MPNKGMKLQDLLRQYSQVFLSEGMGEDPSLVYGQRRREHLQALGSLCVFAGLDRLPGTESVWFRSSERLVQEPALLYLTGINQPGVCLVLNPLSKTPNGREVLFLPPKDCSREFWDGTRLGISEGGGKEESLQELRRVTGIATILPQNTFNSWMREVLQKLPCNHFYAFFHEYIDAGGQVRKITTDYNWQMRKKLLAMVSAVRPGLELKSAAGVHFHLRGPLDLRRQRSAARAQAITRQAFLELLPELSNFTNEAQVDHRLRYLLQKNGQSPLSFPSIIAAGRGAGVLHYQKKDEPLYPGQLLLLDFGIRHGQVHSDISRTVPLNGRFNPLQALLYQIVLDTQKFHQKQVRAGRSLEELESKSWEFLEELLRVRFLSKGGRMRRSYTGKPHGISHLIGEQVHEGDPFRLYRFQPLRAGHMISNEPGLYGWFSARVGGELYEGEMGIRIEDDLLVTEKGCINLSREIPKEIAELESLIKP